METQKSNLFLVVLILGAGFLMLFAFLFVFLFAMIGVESDFSGFKTKDAIGVIEVFDVIEDSLPILDQIDDFAKDDSIAAIVLRVDSPGGAVGPSQEIYRELMKLRGEKTVAVSMGSVAASGGYYIACAGERVFTAPGTLTGSIGVIVESAYLEELMQTIKIKPLVYKSGEHKDMLSPFRKMTESDEAIINDVIRDVHEQFVSDVAQARGMTPEALKPYADGRIMTGAQAKELGLVDEFGSFRDAVEYLAEKEGLGSDPELVYPRKEPITYIEELFRSAAHGLMRAMSGSVHPTVQTRVGR